MMSYFERKRKLSVFQIAKEVGTTWAKVNYRILTGEIPPPTEPLPQGKLLKSYKPEVFALCVDYMRKLKEQEELRKQTVANMIERSSANSTEGSSQSAIEFGKSVEVQ